MRSRNRFFALAALGLALALTAGCAATYTSIRYKEMQVQNKMSASIFLEPVAPAQRTVFVQVRNTSDKQFGVAGEIRDRIQASGYKIVDDPAKAHYMVQANILQVGVTDKDATEVAGATTFGGPLAGAAAGGLLGGDQAVEGAVIGGVVGAAAEMIGDASVQVVTYMVITDLQISERTKGAVSQDFTSNLKQGTADTTVSQRTAGTTNWKRYQTRIVSTARKANLTWPEAAPALRNGIAQSIGNVL